MTFKNNTKALLLCLLLLAGYARGLHAQDRPRILIYGKHTAHASVADAIKAIQKIALENDLAADTSQSSAVFTEDNLKKYAAVVFVSTSGNGLDSAQRTDFVRYIEAGGGFAGIHATSTGGKGWPWFTRLVGASFASHPEPKEGVLHNEAPGNEITRYFPDHMTWKDEWYNFSDLQSGLNVLLSVDEATYVGGEHGKDHPISWYHDYDGGRAFYTALGHFSYHYTDALFVKHLEGGIKYAIGNHVKLDYSKVSMPKYTTGK